MLFHIEHIHALCSVKIYKFNLIKLIDFPHVSGISYKNSRIVYLTKVSRSLYIANLTVLILYLVALANRGT